MITVKINKIEEIENKTKDFPFIGKYIYDDGLIILFIKEKCGIVLSSSSYSSYKESHYVGEYNEDWNICNFKPIDEEVVLRNMK
jgi:hypothetical protein